ncbi:MAG: hypothetical protein ACYCQI_10770 [Gammaproteobacteria bacterium]
MIERRWLNEATKGPSPNKTDLIQRINKICQQSTLALRYRAICRDPQILKDCNRIIEDICLKNASKYNEKWHIGILS